MCLDLAFQDNRVNNCEAHKYDDKAYYPEHLIAVIESVNGVKDHQLHLVVVLLIL